MALQQQIWICGFPSDCRLRERPVQKGDRSLGDIDMDAGGGRPRRRYLSCQWALEPELARLGFRVDQENGKLGRGSCLALGCATVQPGALWDGPLSSWSDAAAMQRMYHQQGNDAYTIVVVNVVRFSRAQPLFL